MEKLKHQVVVQIRDNAEREKNINVLDIKIALLIKNRTTLDDVVESSKKYNKKQRRESENFDHGLKTLEKDTRKKLEVIYLISFSFFFFFFFFIFLTK